MFKGFQFLYSHDPRCIKLLVARGIVCCWWCCLGIRLNVDGEEIELNEFVQKILTGTITGAVTPLRGMRKDWKRIEIIITK
jgi:hypothetical protein